MASINHLQRQKISSHNKGEKLAKSWIGVNLINSFIYLLSALKTFPFPSCLNFLFLDHWAISYFPVLGIYRSCELQQTKTNRMVAQSSFYLSSKMLQNIHSEDKYAKVEISSKTRIEQNSGKSWEWRCVGTHCCLFPHIRKAASLSNLFPKI